MVRWSVLYGGLLGVGVAIGGVKIRREERGEAKETNMVTHLPV